MMLFAFTGSNFFNDAPSLGLIFTFASDEAIQGVIEQSLFPIHVCNSWNLVTLLIFLRLAKHYFLTWSVYLMWSLVS